MQGAAYWRYAEGRELRGVISSRTRFPTIFERFSTRFGTAFPNPDLEPERAVNYELGWSVQLTDGLDLSTALFYADIEDMIQTVVVSAGPPQHHADAKRWRRRVLRRRVRHQAQLAEQWSVAANYTHLEREITDPLQPRHRGRRELRTTRRLSRSFSSRRRGSITPSVELASDRWSEVTGGGYIRIGDYTLLNLQAQYRGGDLWEIAVGGTNLTDEDFQLAHGYPEPGPSAYVRLRSNF